MKTPRELAERMRQQRDDGYLRESFSLPRPSARAKAAEFFKKYPKEAYMTAVDSWRELPGDKIEFTMRRLKSAD